MKGDCPLRPWEIWQLTLPEVSLLLTKTPQRTYSGGDVMSDQQIADYVKWYRELDNRTRLELARRQEL